MPSHSPPAPPLRLANSLARRRAVIGLTPLIDVVFILLVFFMLASSFLDWRSIDLAVPAEGGGAPGVEGALLVEVQAERLRLGGEVVALGTLSARISDAMSEKPERRVVVKPDAGVPLQRAIDVLDALSAAGARNLSLIRDGRG